MTLCELMPQNFVNISSLMSPNFFLMLQNPTGIFGDIMAHEKIFRAKPSVCHKWIKKCLQKHEHTIIL